MDTWNHQQLGKFEHSGYAWKKNLEIKHYENTQGYLCWHKKLILQFGSIYSTVFPSEEAIAVANKTQQNLAKLIDQELEKLYENFNIYNALKEVQHVMQFSGEASIINATNRGEIDKVRIEGAKMYVGERHYIFSLEHQEYININ